MNKCFNCGATERLIYLIKEQVYVCTSCYEFELPRKEVIENKIQVPGRASL